VTNNLNVLLSFLSNITQQANSEASLGKYGGGVAGAAAEETLFIKDHAY
jgi:hypothetical protein